MYVLWQSTCVWIDLTLYIHFLYVKNMIDPHILYKPTMLIVRGRLSQILGTDLLGVLFSTIVIVKQNQYIAPILDYLGIFWRKISSIC